MLLLVLMFKREVAHVFMMCYRWWW